MWTEENGRPHPREDEGYLSDAERRGWHFKAERDHPGRGAVDVESAAYNTR
jgi:hypothetical protein